LLGVLLVLVLLLLLGVSSAGVAPACSPAHGAPVLVPVLDAGSLGVGPVLLLQVLLLLQSAAGTAPLSLLVTTLLCSLSSVLQLVLWPKTCVIADAAPAA
jgi:hypothetical protein